MAVAGLAATFSSEKVAFLLKDELHLGAGDVATLTLIVGLPSYCRFFIGAGADLFSVWGYHRRSYYALSWIFIALGMFGLAFLPVRSVAAVGACIFVAGGGSTLFLVIVDAVMVRVGNETGTIGRLQSIQQGVQMLLGVTFVGPLAGYVTQHWSYQSCFLAAGIAAVVGIALTGLIDERQSVRDAAISPVTERAAERRVVVSSLRKAAGAAGLWALLGYVFYLILTPGTSVAQFYYSVDVLHLSKQTIGNLRIPSSAGSLLGIFAFGVASRRLPVYSLVWGAFAADSISYVVSFALVDTRSAIAVALLNGFIGSIYTLSLITLAARGSPPRVEAAVYGLFTGVIVLAGALSEKLGSTIYDEWGPAHGYSLTHGWQAALWSGLLFTLIGAVFIPFLPAWTKSHEPLRPLQIV